MSINFRSNPPFYWALVFVITAPVIISAILLWTGYVRITEFEKNHTNAAATSTRLVANEIRELLQEKKRLVKIYSEVHAKSIYELAEQPGNEALYKQHRQSLKYWFPGMFTFTITDQGGNPHIDDFDGKIGTVCVEDMQTLARTNQYLIRVHPNPTVYHYDVMSVWNYQLKGGIFFVSFETDEIARRLTAASPPGHELMLLVKDREYLIEITEAGSRAVTPLEDYRLPDLDKQRILQMEKIEGTEWHIADLQEPGLFANYRRQIILTYGAIILTFLIGAAVISGIMICFEKQRRKLARIRDEMLSLFSHDLRSPLVSIIGAIALLRNNLDDMPEEKISNLLEMTLNNATAMNRIVNDILDVHKLESHKMDFSFTQIELNEVCKKACEMNAGYAEEFGVSIDYSLSDEMLFVQADEKRLIQAMTNLLSNAIKYSPENGTVYVRCHRNNNDAVIEIEDFGPGIPEKYHSQLFEKFTQVKQATHKKVASSGLGLTIVKYIIEAHDGSVYFRTQEGKGTTFFVRFFNIQTTQHG